MEARNEGPDMIPVKRNPYLVDYERKRESARNQSQTGEESRGYKYHPASGGGRNQTGARRIGQNQPAGNVRKRMAFPDPHRLTAAKRRRRVQLQRLAFSLGVITLLVLGVGLFLRNNRAAAAGSAQGTVGGNQQYGAGNTGVLPDNTQEPPVEVTVQGIPADVFAKHPDWEEKFLTPNEYSRPGDELKEVKNIFVHYTANPGTSAAQNRSYFERQKDEHKASVSSHFIIGYDGEIIQCVPLTEIAYAVQTRNFDSVSIECCYKAKDGSFTQETYDSLISLLAWLIEAYDLDTGDILRHYDCGGKKCPLYYTNNPDKWEQLKKDVGKAKV